MPQLRIHKNKFLIELCFFIKAVFLACRKRFKGQRLLLKSITEGAVPSRILLRGSEISLTVKFSVVG